MKEYDGTNQIHLTSLEFAEMRSVSDDVVAAARDDIVKTIKFEMRRNLASRFDTIYAHTRQYGIEHRYEWPADWWQGIKDRWFPVWARERWPVRYETLLIFEAFPSISARQLERAGSPVVYYAEHRTG